MSFTIVAKDVDAVKQFVSESELEEIRKTRQAEWEKVRKPEQPIECPDQPQDTRTLYDRLNEQKMRKQEEDEEARKMKNFVRGLESDEVEFLDQVDDLYTKIELDKRSEEKKILQEFKEKVAAISDAASIPVSPTFLTSKRKDSPMSSDGPVKKSHKDLLASVIRPRRSTSEDDNSTVNVPLVDRKSANTTKTSAPLQLVGAYGSDSEQE